MGMHRSSPAEEYRLHGPPTSCKAFTKQLLPPKMNILQPQAVVELKLTFRLCSQHTFANLLIKKKKVKKVFFLIEY